MVAEIYPRYTAACAPMWHSVVPVQMRLIPADSETLVCAPVRRRTELCKVFKDDDILTAAAQTITLNEEGMRRSEELSVPKADAVLQRGGQQALRNADRPTHGEQL